jgi:hypothetical protein
MKRIVAWSWMGASAGLVFQARGFSSRLAIPQVSERRRALRYAPRSNFGGGMSAGVFLDGLYAARSQALPS